jgi:general L-amino acid transport system permease protein
MSDASLPTPSTVRPFPGRPFVRAELAKPLPPPQSLVGPLAWIRTRLFSTPLDAILTIVGILAVAYVAWSLASYALLNATWTGEDGDACRKHLSGACWPWVGTYWKTFIYGRYPLDERWRANIVGIAFFALLIPLAIPSIPGKLINALLFVFGMPVLVYVLLAGGWFGLKPVETTNWGGLMVTLVIAVTGIVASLPIGILLALGRRSKLPIIKLFSVIYIEFWRGVPLITVLFMASNLLPLFLPAGTGEIDKLMRALIGVTLFTAAYMAETIRGGLAAIPKGQYEGAMALGIGYWRMMGLIVMPQALKLVIPGIVGSCISLFKDTTLVQIVNISDLLNTVQSSASDARWASPTTVDTGYLVAALTFFVFCFSMSRYSQFVERRLNTGHKR